MILSGILNKDPAVMLDGARPFLLVLLVLPLLENEFDEVIIWQLCPYDDFINLPFGYH